MNDVYDVLTLQIETFIKEAQIKGDEETIIKLIREWESYKKVKYGTIIRDTSIESNSE